MAWNVKLAFFHASMACAAAIIRLAVPDHRLL
jgi:hypothetical protein